MMLNMNSDHIIDQITKKIKAQIMKINNLFKMKMIISSFMNKIVNSITSNHASEFVIVKT